MVEAHLPQKTLASGAHSARRHSRRRVAPLAAVKAGLLAGAIAFCLLQFIGIVIYDESPWKLLRMVAAMARGPAALEPDDEFSGPLALAGMTLFFALSLLYALALSFLVAESPRRYSALVGLAFGVSLYCANFHGFTVLFPWFISFRTVDTLLVHALFGIAAAQSYGVFQRRT